MNCSRCATEINYHGPRTVVERYTYDCHGPYCDSTRRVILHALVLCDDCARSALGLPTADPDEGDPF